MLQVLIALWIAFLVIYLINNLVISKYKQVEEDEELEDIIEDQESLERQAKIIEEQEKKSSYFSRLRNKKKVESFKKEKK
jgi:hypothetical protein